MVPPPPPPAGEKVGVTPPPILPPSAPEILPARIDVVCVLAIGETELETRTEEVPRSFVTVYAA